MSASSRARRSLHASPAQVLAFDQQAVVEPNEGGKLLEHLLADGFAPKPLLQCVEARRRPRPRRPGHRRAPAVRHRARRGRGARRAIREGRRNIVARTGIDPGLVARPHQLDADTVPFPFCGVVGEIDHRFLQRMRQHEGAEGREIVDVGGQVRRERPSRKAGRRVHRAHASIPPPPRPTHRRPAQGGLCQP